MATIGRREMEIALRRLGELAAGGCEHVELLLLGGAVMVLAFDARESTRDVDLVILAPEARDKVRALCSTVAREMGWPDDWLNDAAKGFFVGPAGGPEIMRSPGILVRVPTVEQLLAMKLCAWRDDVDIADARRLLGELPASRASVFAAVSPYFQAGRELKAPYAFDDLWEAAHGND